MQDTKELIPTQPSATCAHPACQCTVEPGKTYCSQYCEDARDEVEISCDCFHAGCSLNSLRTRDTNL